MKTNKKHRFVHSDPEKQIMTVQKKPGVKMRVSKPANPELTGVRHDLSRVLKSVLFFTLVLALIYFLNSRYDLLGRFGHLLNY